MHQSSCELLAFVRWPRLPQFVIKEMTPQWHITTNDATASQWYTLPGSSEF